VKTPIISIVDDEEDVRDALSLLLRSMDYKVQSFKSAYDYWNQYDIEQPGCLILDVRMPRMSGIELQLEINKLEYHPPIIMISGHGELTMAVNTLRAGALDFLQKPISEQLLLERVQQALIRDQEDRKTFKKFIEIQFCYYKLTARERQVLGHIITGCLNKVIAGNLKLSTRTVEIHRARVMEKMQAKSVAALMRKITILEEHHII